MLRSDDDVLQWIFDGLLPDVHPLPNLVLPTWKRSLELVLKVIGQTGGIWGDDPRYDERGEHYFNIRNPATAFRLWATPPNQEYVRDHGFHSKLGLFTFILDVETPQTVLETFDRAGYSFPVAFPLIVKLIGQLRWVYVPLWDEVPLALFVTRPEDGAWVHRLEQSLQHEGIPYSRIALEGGRETWHLNDELRKLCRLDYGASPDPESDHRMTAPAIEEDVPLPPAEERIVNELRQLEGVILSWNEDSWCFDVETEAELLQVCKSVQPIDRKVILAVNTSYPSVTNDGLAKIPTLDQLVEFSAGPPVTAEGLRDLVRHRNLRKIETTRIPFTGHDVALLRGFAVFPRVDELEIDLVDLGDDVKGQIKSNPAIRKFSTDGELIKG
jgi:hypothetical protein